VFSKSLGEANWGEVRVVSSDPANEIARLKQESGKDLLAHGGARFARYLTSSGLIDEYWLVVHPVALGSGLRLFADLSAPIRFKLIDRTAFESGVTVMTFQPA
jgi:dihydrofolate reductase